jgi:transcriptional regulator with XRE-family HTH domain
MNLKISSIILILIIFILFFEFDSVQISFFNQAVRVIRGGELSLIKSYTYDTLAKAIEQGKKLIPPEGKQVVDVRGVGRRNLKNLNNIDKYYRGREALFYLACDLEQAIKKGYIEISDAKNGVDVKKLSQALSKEFKKRQAMIGQFLDWQDFFRIKQKLGKQKSLSSPAKYKYMWNEGLIKLAVEENISEVKYLFYAFGDKYGWSFMNFSLRDLEKAKKIFEKDPNYYIGNEGLIELAKEANIDSIKGLFSSREYLPNYEQSIHNWTAVYPTYKGLEIIREKFKQNEDRYRKPSGMYELLSELLKENIKSPESILSIKDILPEYKQSEYRWDIQFLPIDKLNAILNIFRKSPSKYIGNVGLKLLCKEARINNYHWVYLAREFLPKYSDEKFGWDITFLTESEQLEIFERLDSLTSHYEIDLDDLSYEDKIRLVDQIKTYGEGAIGEFLQREGKLGAEVLIHSNIPVNRLFDIAKYMGDDYKEFFNPYLEIDKSSKELSSLYGINAKGLKPGEKLDIKLRKILENLENEVRGVFYNVNTLILEELSNIVSDEKLRSKRKQTFLKAYQDILTVLYVLNQYKNDSFEISHGEIHEPGEATYVRFEDFYEQKPLNILLTLYPAEIPSIAQPGIRWMISPDTENPIRFFLDKDLTRKEIHINFSSKILKKIYNWAKRKRGDHFLIKVPNLWRNFSRVVRIFY